MTAQSVIISGAGVGGLSAAWWLSGLGWQVTLVEQAPDLRADGYMIGISGPGYQAAERMGLLDDLQQYNHHIRENLYLDTQGKELLKVRYHDILGSLDWLTLARTDLVRELHRKVTEETNTRICFATRITEFSQNEDKVTVNLSDGQQLTADLLIGADGIHSSTRKQLLGDKPEQLEHLGYRVAAFQAPDSLGLKNDFLSYAQPGQLVEFYTLQKNRLAGLYLWKDDDIRRPQSRQEARQWLTERYSSSHPEALHCLQQLPDDEPLFFDSLTMVTLPEWSKGRVLLLGDAAHCLTLLSGQGAGMAMMSACVLAEKLKHHAVPEALALHEQQLRPAITGLQQRSRDIAPWFIPATPRSFRLRNLLLKWLPKRFIGWYFLRAVRADILAANQVVQS